MSVPVLLVESVPERKIMPKTTTRRIGAALKAGNIKSAPLEFSKGLKREVRTQFGAICWRKKEGRLQVLLVTSRGTGRWIVPKGWPMPGLTPAEAAAREAYEEAGVSGKVTSDCLGLFSYTKTYSDDADDLPCMVALFPLQVKKRHQNYPEKAQRRRKWVSPKKASKMVDEPELREIIRNFTPA